MKLNNLNIFPTEITTFELNKEEIQPLLDEISKSKKKIKETSKYYNNQGGVGEYYTDYGNPTKLHEYEKLMIMVGNYFANMQKNFKMLNYWSALYYDNSFHETHNHVNFLTQKTCNYSSVLSLTNQGGTKFLSSSPTSLIHSEIVNSRVGKLIFFPSNLLHSGVNETSGERIIISSNLSIYDV
jgi:hypothetical protein